MQSNLVPSTCNNHKQDPCCISGNRLTQFSPPSVSQKFEGRGLYPCQHNLWELAKIKCRNVMSDKKSPSIADVVLSGGAEVASDIRAEVVTGTGPEVVPGTDPSEQVPDSSPTACIASLFSVSSRTLSDTPLTPRLVPVRGYIWSGLE